MDKVNEIFLAAGYPKMDDSYYTKCLNKILVEGVINVYIAPLGKYASININGKSVRFNLQIKIHGFVRRVFYNPYVSPDIILKEIATMLSDNKISGKHKAFLEMDGKQLCECPKCNGKGLLPQYNHIAGGICYNCYGSGYTFQSYLKNGDYTKFDLVY